MSQSIKFEDRNGEEYFEDTKDVIRSSKSKDNTMAKRQRSKGQTIM
jgi:hypothetical protein